MNQRTEDRHPASHRQGRKTGILPVTTENGKQASCLSRPSHRGISPLLFLILAIVLSVAVPTGFGQTPEKSIALTFDEVPFMQPLGFWRPREISNLILDALEAENIKAAGFVVQEKVEDQPSTYIILSDWVTRGHILGNQTWGDADLNVIDAESFLEHATDGQKYLRRISRAHPFNYRYLRFPQLHEGNDKKKKKRIRKALDRGSYQIAHVSVKTTDWAFNRLFQDSLGKQERTDALKKLYLAHVLQSLDYSEKQSEAVFGRNIKQILQLRSGVATAHFLPDLIKALRERGYSFVSFPDALSDPAYQTPEEYVGPLGLIFIDRVAATKGLPFDESAGETSPSQVEKDLESRLQDISEQSR